MSFLNLFFRLLAMALLLPTSIFVYGQGIQSYVDESYVGMLSFTIDGVKYNHSDIMLSAALNPDGTISLSLKDFILVKGEEIKPLGNVTLSDIMAIKDDAINRLVLSSVQTVSITDGTLPNTDDPSTPSGGDGNTISGSDQKAEGGWGDGPDIEVKEWTGKSYGPMGVTVTGELARGYADISFDIYVTSLAKTVKATFQTPNVVTAIVAPHSLGAAVRSQRRASIINSPFSSLHPQSYTVSGTRYHKGYRGIVIF